MKKALLASVAALAAGAGIAFGQNAPIASSDPKAIAAVGTPMVDPNVTQVIGSKEPLYLQGGPQMGYGDFPKNCGPQGCGAGGCGAGGCGPAGCYGPEGYGGGPGGCGGPGGGCTDGSHCCGSILGLFCNRNDGPGAGSCGQVHKAAGGPDCFYFDIDSTYYYFRSMPISAPLLTAGPLGSTGRVGDPGVNVLVGENNVRFGPLPALRLNMGVWDECRCIGIGASGFITEQRAEVDNFNAPITGRVVLGRPYNDVLTGVPDAIIVSNPVIFDPNIPGPPYSGFATVYFNTRAGGADVNLLRNWAYYDKFKFTGLMGIRYFSLNEQMRIDSTSIIPSANPDDPSIRQIVDSFVTHNDFYGAQLGFDMEYRLRRWFTDITVKVAPGFTHEELNQSGYTRFAGPVLPNERVLRDPAATTIVPGGLLVLDPNSGEFSKKKFSVLSELNFKLGYQWTQRFSTYLGYDGMYISKVVRPGEQVNGLVNPSLIPVSSTFNPQLPFGPAEPSLVFKSSDFFMNGFSIGGTFRY